MSELDLEAARVTVGTAPTVLIDAGPDYIEATVRARSGLVGDAFVGGPNVTTASGYRIAPGEQLTVKLRPGGKLYGIATTSVTLDVALTRLT